MQKFADHFHLQTGKVGPITLRVAPDLDPGYEAAIRLMFERAVAAEEGRVSACHQSFSPHDGTGATP